MNRWGDYLREIEEYEHTDIPWWWAAAFAVGMIVMLACAMGIAENGLTLLH